MVTRTFLSKCTTIFYGSKDNFGLNPIAMLDYGNMLSRCLVYFDMDNINSLVNEGYDMSNMKHILKMTNCGEIDETFVPSSDANGRKERTSSFDIIAFKLPEKWDAGKGFDNSTDYWLVGKSSVSQHGATWYNAYDGKEWGVEINESGETIGEEGVYSTEFLAEEVLKYNRKEKNLIIGRQSFDRGNENFEIDITSYVNEILAGETENFGIGLAFSPSLENLILPVTQYVGFFTNTTNTFFKPVVESRTEDKVLDNRYSFHIGQTNRLYFYAVLDGVNVDLDNLPVCEINGVEYPVKRQNRGVYYAEVLIPNKSVASNSILYDTWSNLVYKGEELDDIELEFVILPKENFLSLGEDTSRSIKVEPSISGMNDNEKIFQGDERTMDVKFRIPYSSDYELMNECYYRLYVKDGNREITVINWDAINVEGMKNTFRIKSAELMPQEYHIDVKARCGKDIRIFKDKLTFEIVNNVTNIKK